MVAAQHSIRRYNINITETKLDQMPWVSLSKVMLPWFFCFCTSFCFVLCAFCFCTYKTYFVANLLCVLYLWRVVCKCFLRSSFYLETKAVHKSKNSGTFHNSITVTTVHIGWLLFNKVVLWTDNCTGKHGLSMFSRHKSKCQLLTRFQGAVCCLGTDCCSPGGGLRSGRATVVRPYALAPPVPYLNSCIASKCRTSCSRLPFRRAVRCSSYSGSPLRPCPPVSYLNSYIASKMLDWLFESPTTTRCSLFVFGCSSLLLLRAVRCSFLRHSEFHFGVTKIYLITYAFGLYHPPINYLPSWARQIPPTWETFKWVFKATVKQVLHF
jgi:hypothetical protein